MNARLAIQENERLTKEILETAKRVSKVRSITITEALDYGLKVSLKYAKTNNEKAAIEIRFKNAKNSLKQFKVKFRSGSNREVSGLNELILMLNDLYDHTKFVRKFDRNECKENLEMMRTNILNLSVDKEVKDYSNGVKILRIS